MFTSLSAGSQFAPSTLSPPAAWPPADAPRFQGRSRPALHRSPPSPRQPQRAAEDWRAAKACCSLAAVNALFPERRKVKNGLLTDVTLMLHTKEIAHTPKCRVQHNKLHILPFSQRLVALNKSKKQRQRWMSHAGKTNPFLVLQLKMMMVFCVKYTI